MHPFPPQRSTSSAEIKNELWRITQIPGDIDYEFDDPLLGCRFRSGVGVVLDGSVQY